MFLIGIDQDHDEINVAIMKGNALIATHTVRSGAANVKELYIILNRYQSAQIVSGLSSQEMILKKRSIPTTRTKAVEQAIPFQLKNFFLFDSDKTLGLPIIQNKDKQNTHLTFFLTTHEKVQKHLCSLKKLQIDPDYVSAVPMAITRFVKKYTPNYPNCITLHFSNKTSTCLLIENFHPIKAVMMPFAAKSLIEALKKDKPKKWQKEKIDLEKIDTKSYPATTKVLREWKLEFEKILYSFLRNYENKKLPILFTGTLPDQLLGLEEYLYKNAHPNLSSILTSKSFDKLKHFAICIGLALDATLSDQNSLQFRQNQLIPKRHIQSLFIRLGSFLLFCSIFSIAFLFLGKSIFHNKQKKLKERFEQLETSENQYFSSVKPNSTFDSLEDQIDKLQKNIKKQSRYFPYFVLTPKVSQVLHWLKNSWKEHLKNLEIDLKDQKMQILSFHYELLNYPSSQEPQNPYITKVETKLSIDDPFLAQSFYESLLKQKNIIETENEISWKTDENHYTMSFYLKNQPLSQYYENKNF